MVISGVAEKMEKSIGSFVLLDAFFPETGEALVEGDAETMLVVVEHPPRRTFK
jgi:hypothetical protein